MINEAVEESKENIKDEKDIEFYSDKDNYDKLISAIVSSKVIQMSNSSVWFKIFEHYGEYYIGLYYDNLLNAPNGEDL